MDRAAEGTAGGSACTWAPTAKRMEEPVSIDTVVLDLDGTLVDSVYVHVTC